MLERETEGAKAKASQSIWPIHSWNGDVHARVCVCVCVCVCKNSREGAYGVEK